MINNTAIQAGDIINLRQRLWQEKIKLIIRQKYVIDFPAKTFWVLKNKEISNYGEYRIRRLVLEKWDEMFS